MELRNPSIKMHPMGSFEQEEIEVKAEDSDEIDLTGVDVAEQVGSSYMTPCYPFLTGSRSMMTRLACMKY